MMMKKMLTAAAVLCLALLAASCIYPFTPEPEDGSGTLVVEGDILIGEYSTIVLSYAVPVDRPFDIRHPANGEVWVEDDAGIIYSGKPQSPNYWEDTNAAFTVDTREADPSRNYRLHVKAGVENYHYMSSWERVCNAPVIDSLSYNLDFERSRFNVALSMHSQNESFFRWSYVEDWEFHAMYRAELEAVQSQGWNPTVTVRAMEKPGSLYSCYGHEVSTQIMTFSTEKQSDDRFVDLEFRPIDRSDRRISYLYRIVVNLEPLSKDAYQYWETIKTNSDYNGNLFAPNPSELVGNIRCEEDPDVLVLGYINVAQRASKEMVVDYSEHGFYKSPDAYYEPEMISRSQWNDYYKNGFLPITYGLMPGDLSTTYWAPARCVDCLRMGKNGSKGATQTRPEGWPPKI